MIIELKNIGRGPHEYSFCLEPGWWTDDEDASRIAGLDGSLKADISISKSGDKFLLMGHLSGALLIYCDRCLEPFRHALEKDFKLFLSLPPGGNEEAEIELSEEDMVIDFILSEEIDLGDIVREQIFLHIPMKSLCSDNCDGLCVSCGANLNEKECGCKKEEGHPAFSKLKSLKF
jgi:uncharacterized protein